MNTISLNFRNFLAFLLIICSMIIKQRSFTLFDSSISLWNTFVNFNNHSIIRNTLESLSTNHNILKEVNIYLKENETLGFSKIKTQEWIFLENYQNLIDNLDHQFSLFNFYNKIFLFCETFLILGIFFIFYKKTQIKTRELLLYFLFFLGFTQSMYSIQDILIILEHQMDNLKSYEILVLKLLSKLKNLKSFSMLLSNIKSYLKNTRTLPNLEWYIRNVIAIILVYLRHFYW